MYFIDMHTGIPDWHKWCWQCMYKNNTNWDFYCWMLQLYRQSNEIQPSHDLCVLLNYCFSSLQFMWIVG